MKYSAKYATQAKYRKYLVRASEFAFGNQAEIQLDAFFLLSRRYLEIHNQLYRRNILSGCFKEHFFILVGQRGVGKTTFIIQYLLAQVGGNILSSEVLYVPADHFLLGKNSLYAIAEAFANFGGKIIAFDEIHKYKNWSQELKSITETFPKLKIIASGSSALEIYRGSHDLSRRALVYRMPGLSLREYLELTLNVTFSKYSLQDILESHETITVEILKHPIWAQEKILALFKQYLMTGYFPFFLALRDPNHYLSILEQNIHAVIESDLVAIYPALTGNSVRKIKHLLAFIAATVPFIPQMNALKNIIDVGDERTLKTYLKYLEDAELIKMLMAASSKMSKIEAVEKIYLGNPNQAYAISANTSDINIGTVRELFFLNMLSYEHEVAAPKEGDFVVDQQILFEIGGSNKSFEQIKNKKLAYLALDAVEKGIANKIPLWLFGFLY